MHAAFFRELRPYSEAEIQAAFAVEVNAARLLIAALMKCGILRYRTGDEREGDREDSLGASEDQRFQFRYVGIAIARGQVIVCYPKYIKSSEVPVHEMRQALAVIGKLGKEGRLADAPNSGSADGHLAVILRLLHLYGEYGVYSNFEETRVLNGSGAIDWPRTVDSQIPAISNGIPVYLDLWTHKARRDEHNLVVRLHRAILSECSRFLDGCGLSDLLSIDTVEITDENPRDMGDTEYLLWLIDRERSTQYTTWKQATLDLMRAYLADEVAIGDESIVLRLGTTIYYHAWEIACKVAFGDLLGYKLGNLPIKLCDNWSNRTDETLLEIIPHPSWERPVITPDLSETDTLIPDTVTFAEIDSRKFFCIFDAKYYVPTERGKMNGQPGVESVTKQFLYQSAYHDFIKDHDFDAVLNSFFIPVEGDSPRLIAKASFRGVMSASTSELPQFSDCIDMWGLPAEAVFECYLRGELIDEGVLRSIIGVG